MVSQQIEAFSCHECEWFKHYQTKCATFLKKKKKSLTFTLSDGELTSDSDAEEFGRALINITTYKKLIDEDDSSKRKDIALISDHQMIY